MRKMRGGQCDWGYGPKPIAQRPDPPDHPDRLALSERGEPKGPARLPGLPCLPGPPYLTSPLPSSIVMICLAGILAR